eukprot:g4891.t1
MLARHCCGEDGDGSGGRRPSKGMKPPTSMRHAGSLSWSGPVNAPGCTGRERPQQGRGGRRRRRRRPTSPPHPLSRLAFAVHFALVLVIAAGGRTSEWQHPHRRTEPPHSSLSSRGAGAGTVDWGARGSGSGRKSAGAGKGGGWRGDECKYRGGYSEAGRRWGGGGAGAGGGKGSRRAREEARGWSERKKVGSESMREIIELAKADAKAVRAAAEDAAAAAAAAAEAEAAWAAAGVGSGGGGGENAMLFLECEVNGRALRAFVDTGAQVTVMSAACAERCGLASRIDKRFAGRAVGVGFARILGRIHDANIRIGNSYLRCSFTVIEHGEIDLLVGLDVLRAHRCDISLSKNRMKFHAEGGAREVAFLTRVERDGKRRRPRRPSQPVSEPRSTYAYHDDPGQYDFPPEPAVAFQPSAPPPRVLREMARDRRGDQEDGAAAAAVGGWAGREERRLRRGDCRGGGRARILRRRG